MVNDSKEQITLRMNQVLAEFEGMFNQTCNQNLVDFLVLYYEFFIAVHEDDGEEEIMTLEDTYRSFADHLNPVFNKSRYAEISSKSMPDMILILFAYNMVSLLS